MEKKNKDKGEKTLPNSSLTPIPIHIIAPPLDKEDKKLSK